MPRLLAAMVSTISVMEKNSDASVTTTVVAVDAVSSTVSPDAAQGQPCAASHAEPPALSSASSPASRATLNATASTGSVQKLLNSRRCLVCSLDINTLSFASLNKVVAWRQNACFTTPNYGSRR